MRRGIFALFKEFSSATERNIRPAKTKQIFGINKPFCRYILAILIKVNVFILLPVVFISEGGDNALFITLATKVS